MLNIVEPIKIEEFTNDVNINKYDYTVEGNGIFDKLMDTATKHLKAQFEGNRIREEDYASAYIEIFKYVLQTALEIWLKKGIAEAQLKLTEKQTEKQLELLTKQTDLVAKQADQAAKQTDQLVKQTDLIIKQTDQVAKQTDLLVKQADLVAKQTETENTKQNLYKRQTESFDENYKEKILRIMMDSWGIGFSVAKDSFDAEGIPAPMQKASIDNVFNKFVLPDLDNFVYGRGNGVVEKPTT